MRELVIFGAGGNSLDILDAALTMEAATSEPCWSIAGFLDDSDEMQGKKVLGYPVLGDLSLVKSLEKCYYINGIGNERNYRQRSKIIAAMSLPSEQYATIVHRNASVSSFADVGNGVAVLANSVICARATIKNHVIILPGTVVNHDCLVDEYTCIASGVCLTGNVVVEPDCYIGTNVVIRPGVRIGRGALIGAGSVVLHDVQENVVVVGNPARILRNLSVQRPG